MTREPPVFAEQTAMSDNIYIESALTVAVWLVGLTWMYLGAV